MSQERCLALSLKGGANRGAYEAGAISRLVEMLPSEETQYDVLSGISVGALNAAYISTFPKGQEQEMAIGLISLWKNLTQDHFFKSWEWGGVLNGLLFQKGLYDNSPLVEYLGELFRNRTIVRMLSYDSVNANDGNVYNVKANYLNEQDVLKTLIASASVPFIFPYVEFEDKVLIDGGSVWNLDIVSAVERCRELVDDDSKIFVDVIDVERNLKAPYQNKSSYFTVSNYLRYRSIKNYYTHAADLIEIQRAYPKVNYRYIISPEQNLDSLFDEISVDPILIQGLIDKGRLDVERLLNRTNSTQS